MANSSQDPFAEIARKEVDAQEAEIASLNEFIHSHPELAYEEHQAHDYFVSLLTRLFQDGSGVVVTPHAYGVPTSFAADYGAGGRLVVFNAEYDALPDIGHGCGHNLIASAGLAAFLGLVAALKASGRPGRVRLLGTPAEEGGGGKLKLLEGGAYRGADASLMVHPGPGYLMGGGVSGGVSGAAVAATEAEAGGEKEEEKEEVKEEEKEKEATTEAGAEKEEKENRKETPSQVAFVRMLANVKMRVFFTGREAHAAMAPWSGVNALDAVCLAYNAVSMLRQQIRPHERIHGVFRQAGDRPNVTPAHTSVEYYVRSDTRAAAEALWARVQQCFAGAALATGCGVQYERINAYADVRPSPALCRAYVAALPAGVVAYSDPADVLAGSTDMGNVCYACPGFHGAFGIATAPGQGNHTKGFAAAAALPSSFQSALACGKGMAVVGWRVLRDDAFAAQMRAEWEEDMRVAGGGVAGL